MKFAKKIELKLTVKDNPFLKEQVQYLQNCCNFSTVDEHDWCNEKTELVALIDSDEFIVTLSPVEHRNGELTIVDDEFEYIIGLTFKGTSMTGIFYGSYAPYVLLTPSEVFNLIFNLRKYHIDDVDDGVNLILSMVFGLKHEAKFKYEII